LAETQQAGARVHHPDPRIPGRVRGGLPVDADGGQESSQGGALLDGPVAGVAEVTGRGHGEKDTGWGSTIRRRPARWSGPSAWLRRISSLYAALRRVSPIPEPARRTPASTVSSTPGGTRPSIGSHCAVSLPSSARRADRSWTRRTTWWPSVRSAWVRADLMSPGDRVIATRMAFSRTGLGRWPCGHLGWLSDFEVLGVSGDATAGPTGRRPPPRPA